MAATRIPKIHSKRFSCRDFHLCQSRCVCVCMTASVVVITIVISTPAYCFYTAYGCRFCCCLVLVVCAGGAAGEVAAVRPQFNFDLSVSSHFAYYNGIFNATCDPLELHLQPTPLPLATRFTPRRVPSLFRVLYQCATQTYQRLSDTAAQRNRRSKQHFQWVYTLACHTHTLRQKWLHLGHSWKYV